jgi:hypothetical protein
MRTLDVAELGANARGGPVVGTVYTVFLLASKCPSSLRLLGVTVLHAYAPHTHQSLAVVVGTVRTENVSSWEGFVYFVSFMQAIRSVIRVHTYARMACTKSITKHDCYPQSTLSSGEVRTSPATSDE